MELRAVFSWRGVACISFALSLFFINYRPPEKQSDASLAPSASPPEVAVTRVMGLTADDFAFPRGHVCEEMNQNEFFHDLLVDMIKKEPKGTMYGKFMREDRLNPKLGDCASRALGQLKGFEDTGKDDPEHVGALGPYNKEVADEMVRELEKTGATKVPVKLSQEWVEQMLNLLRNELKFEVRKPHKSNISFNWDKPVSKTHWGTPDSIKKLQRVRPIRDLLVDPTILDIAQRYLGAPPIITQVNTWWSVAANTSSDATQVFHQDGSWVKLLKLFIYLDDITDENGPFAYVPSSKFKSHLLPSLSSRITDDKVRKLFGDDSIKHAIGPAGTMHFCDTRNLHRGTPVIKGHRTVIQVEYACSLYRNDLNAWIHVPEKGDHDDFMMHPRRKRIFMRFRPEKPVPGMFEKD